jgi:hypothetical protein
LGMHFGDDGNISRVPTTPCVNYSRFPSSTRRRTYPCARRLTPWSVSAGLRFRSTRPT